MLGIRLVPFIIAAVVWAQNDGIYGRLRRALAKSGEGEAAAVELSKKHYAQVEEMLDRAKGLDETSSAELLSLQGALAFLDGSIKLSVLHFQEAAALAPLGEGDAFTLAMALAKLGDDGGSRHVLAQLSQKHPEHALYVYWLGRLDYDQRRYEEAVERLKKAVELDPNSARFWDSLGLAYDMQGQMEQAHEAFEKAVSLNRAQLRLSPWPPHDLGYWLLRMDRPKEAEAALREALRYDAKLAPAHYHLGRTLEKEGRDAEAIDEYRAAVSNDVSSADACYSLATLYRKLHRNAEANAMFAEYRKRREAQAPPALKTLDEPAR
jgi:tetratricopeptide (TPR) repeat protein